MSHQLVLKEYGNPEGLRVLFVHALGASPAVWKPVIAAMSQEYRCVTVTLPGHDQAAPAKAGLSIADMAQEITHRSQEESWGEYVCVGISIGGAIALELALGSPPGLLGVVVACSAARIGSAQSWEERAHLVRQAGTGALIDSAGKRWFAEGFSAREPEVVGELMNDLLGTDDESYAILSEALGEWDREGDISAISLPTLVISGELDPATPVEQGMAIAESIEDSFFVSLAGASHLCSIEKPEDTTAVIVRFLTGITAPETRPSRTGGFRTRREVLGDEHVTRAQSRADRYSSLFHDFITRYAWGDVWSRPGLDRRSRSVATLAALVAMGNHHEVAMHIRAARRNGLSEDEIAEVFLHVSLYAGLPRSNTAFQILRDVLEQDEK
jgi:3-oxoadipate enol-lactonase/4-carboxymuconolactone decarboxylase